ncbi:hypothetical protein C8J56DRAFT_799565 [Mycena floridula]|nr:hypothetical protein C8J56DRAFT_799565 [Mycena floridula]
MAAEHGLKYSFEFISSLDSRNNVHLLPPTTFSDLQLEHTVAHPPDGALFPFLHGLEGDNEAQNIFFASHGQSVVSTKSSDQPQNNTVPVPKYRGLMWVVCEEDLEHPSLLGLLAKPSPAESSNYSEDDSDYDFDDDEEDYELDEDEDELVDEYGSRGQDSSNSSLEDPPPTVDMDVDVVDSAQETSPITFSAHDSIEIVGIGTDSKHMHPVSHRLRPIQTTNLHPPSDISSSSTSTDGDYSVFSSAGETTADTPATSPSPSLLPKPKLSKSKLGATSSTIRSPRKKRPTSQPPLLTSTFREKDLIRPVSGGLDEECEFLPAKVPDGISLRNFGIQVPILATLSDIVIYSPTSQGAAHSDNAVRLAQRFRMAIERKRRERCTRLGIQDGHDELLRYNVFILDATAEQIRTDIPHLVMRVCPSGQVPGSLGPGGKKSWNPILSPPPTADAFDMDMDVDYHDVTPFRLPSVSPNTVDFAQRERDEMRDLTKASEIISVLPSSTSSVLVDYSTTATHFDPAIGQVFLGNSNDVPISPESEEDYDETEAMNGPPPLPRAHPLNSYYTNSPERGFGYDICIECHDMAPFPSEAHMKAAEEKVVMLEEMWTKIEAQRRAKDSSGWKARPRPPPHANSIIHLPFPSSPVSSPATMAALVPVISFLERCLMPAAPPVETAPETNRAVSSSSSSRRWSSQEPSEAPSLPWSRPLKILLYSSDGYTESSVPALCLLMAVKGLSLPEAYLELQVVKRRSFFVYQYDLGILRRVESKFIQNQRLAQGRPPAKSVSFAQSPMPQQANADASKPPPATESSSPMVVPSQNHLVPKSSATTPPSTGSSSVPGATTMSLATKNRRPRASTSPWLPSLFGGDHQAWFNDPRFDGSFPSRVLPFLYLGNLAHASNAYMLHALGITHVVSVGECALVPPPNMQSLLNSAANGSSTFSCNSSSAHGHFIPGKGPGHQGSLWIEERAGRIKVLDIQGVCDDGIDTLEPQLEPICEWIDKARKEGGQVLVHCRVGVSRSATVTIAYVMKHLGLSLVDAYLIVRSRRLSVLIQPNMRLLYNLCGWEIKLAKERASDNPEKLRKELSSALSWPYLAKEVHSLNEKYLH